MFQIDRHSKRIYENMLFKLVIKARHEFKHFSFFVKWLLIALVMGVICGLVGSAFHYALDLAAATSAQFGRTLFMLPLAGLAIVFLYRQADILNDEGTNSILRAARAEDHAALRLTPLIFLSSFLTHLCCGSAGREGAALQIGGSIGSFVGRKLKFSIYDTQLLVMCGMSATFCALFSTPLTAAFFSMEVAGVGTVFYAGLVPVVTASYVAMMVSHSLGITSSFNFITAEAADIDILLLARVLFLAVLFAYMSIAFCTIMHNTRTLYSKYIENPYIRIVVGGLLVIGLTLLIGSRDYNGIGINVINQALSGQARPEAFALKMILTALTLGAGYKGGEIVPTLFIGATFGCTAASLIGLDPILGAELGMVGLFCGAINCPISSIILSVELFGSENFLLFGATAAVSYLLSGYYSLYSGQKFMNSKIVPVPFERKAS